MLPAVGVHDGAAGGGQLLHQPVERRDPGAQLHVRGEVAVDGADVAPVGRARLVADRRAGELVAGEVVGEDPRALGDQAGDDVPAEVVARGAT